MIVVLGLYRGGSSTVAGVLHHLGVCMGHELKVVPQAESARYCTFEDWPLRRACLCCRTEPGLEAHRGYRGRVRVLRRYLQDRLNHPVPPIKHSRDTFAAPVDGCACQRGGPIGVKFPMLCALGPEAQEAWADHDPVYVSVERDPRTVIRSLRRWFGGLAEPLTRRLIAERCTFLARHDHVAVSYDRLCENPAAEVRRLAKALGLVPGPDRIRRAARFVCRPTYEGAAS